MTKDRVGSFIDAVLAIIITILVLNLKTPSELTWKGFLSIHESIIAYTVSFFWIGTIWAVQIIGWSRFYSIDRKTILWVLLMLFATSLFPWMTNIVADHLYDATAEILYGLLSIFITVTNMAVTRSINRANSRRVFGWLYVFPDRLVVIDIGVKVLGFFLCFLWPPAMMVALTINIILRIAYLILRPEILGVDQALDQDDSCDVTSAPESTRTRMDKARKEKLSVSSGNSELTGHTDL